MSWVGRVSRGGTSLGGLLVCPVLPVRTALGHTNFPCAELGRHDPPLGAVTVASSPLAALVGLGTERSASSSSLGA